MLKFYRKIRQELLSENHFSKYFLYALGEILLVVIGILIALQINNWNEQRKESRQEWVALNDLKLEFEKNKTNFLTHADWQNGVEKSWATYLSIISNKSLANAERAIERPRVGYAVFSISNNKLNSLLSTGVIDKIKNDSLKQLLFNWNDVLLTYQGIEIQHEYHAKQRLIVIEQSLRPNPNHQYITGIKTTFYEAEELEQIAIDALEDMQYQNALIMNHHWLKLKANRQGDIIQYLNQIIAQLNRSLEEGGVLKYYPVISHYWIIFNYP